MRILTLSILLCVAYGCANRVERPAADGLIHAPRPVDLGRERDTRMSVLHALHPDPIRPDPVFTPSSPNDLLANDLHRLDELLKAGQNQAALILVRALIQRVRADVEYDQRIMREVAERRQALQAGIAQ